MTGRIAIGGAAGFWGDAALATPQLLAGGAVDYLVYDYLAEITLSILARARAADDSKGYATDFVTAAMAWLGSSAGMMPSVRHRRWKASSASLSVMPTYSARPMSFR